jgi:hypothetical protein
MAGKTHDAPLDEHFFGFGEAILVLPLPGKRCIPALGGTL